MKELLKLAMMVSNLPMALIGFILASALFTKKEISFEQWIILVCFALVIHLVIANKTMGQSNLSRPSKAKKTANRKSRSQNRR